MKYFDSKYQSEQEIEISTNDSIVNAGKYVYYRNVYIFIDKLKNVTNQHLDIKLIIILYFRDSALM